MIVNGTKYRETVFIKGTKGEEIAVDIRPLSDGEYNEIKAIKNKGVDLDIKGDIQKLKKDKDLKGAGVKIDLVQLQKAEFEGDVLAVFYGLIPEAGEEWIEEDIRNLPAGYVKQISKHIYILSGVIEEVEKDKELLGNIQSEDSEVIKEIDSFR
jgi:hypothetical protein